MKFLFFILFFVSSCAGSGEDTITERPKGGGSCDLVKMEGEWKVSCPEEPPVIVAQPQPEDRTACYLEEGVSPPVITCGDTSITLEEGQKGLSCTVVEKSDGALIICEDGTQAVVKNGADGQNGIDGIDGEDGVSCTAVRATNGAVIQCGETSVAIFDGVDGLDGQDAVSPGIYGISEIIDPCGDNPGEFDEVIVKLASGDLLVYFEQKGAHFLTVLEPGEYETTDKQKCEFTVTPLLDVIW